jgi:hypothetical protein
MFRFFSRNARLLIQKKILVGHFDPPVRYLTGALETGRYSEVMRPWWINPS